MPKKLRWKGSTIVRPGQYTFYNLDSLLNVDLTKEATVLVIGEATAGEPMSAITDPVVHYFKSSKAMIDTFVSGNLADVANVLFDPVIAGQTEQGVELKGVDTVIAIKTNLSTQAARNVMNAAGAQVCFSVRDRLWGALGNGTWFQILISGTGLKFVAGRDAEPNIGSQDSSDSGDLFSITGIDEWFSVTTTGAFTGVSCAYDYGTTVPATFTLNSSVAGEDMAIAAAGKTISEVLDIINTFDPHGTGPIYSATLLRPDRGAVVSTYTDITAPANCLGPAVAKNNGVSYDMVEYINNYSDYLEATWVGGYEPSGAAYSAKTYCIGGAIGDSSTTRIGNALKVAARLNTLCVASGFNAASVGGAVSLAESNNLFSLHATNCNRLGSTRERQVFISNDDATKAAMYTTVGAFNNMFLNCSVNRIYRENASGVRSWLGAHTVACAKAAIVAAAPKATPLLWKRIKCYDFDFVAADFDVTDDTDFANAQDVGACFLEPHPKAGVRIATGITTFSAEDNDGKCLMESVNAQMWWKITQRNYRERKIGNKSAGTLTAEEILNLTNDANAVMADLSDPDFLLIPGTDKDGNYQAAYSGFTCTMNGNAYVIRGQLFFTCGVRFIMDDIVALQPRAVV